MQTLFGGGLLSYMLTRHGPVGTMAILAVVILALVLIAFLINKAKRRKIEAIRRSSWK
ncbi:MAG: hypothetical protein WCL27_17580 [Betaproteobacteria bacterium]